MMKFTPPRVMWLLNHGSARKFELAMLKTIGVKEIFLPKSYPNDINFRSASVDFSEDATLSIPRDELEVLNATNWYGRPSKEAWDIANRYFDVLFFILYDPETVSGIAKNFNGMVLWRAYGLFQPLSYAGILDELAGGRGEAWIRSLGKRFFFAEAYPHLHRIEPDYLKDRRLYLPLGMHDCSLNDAWTGDKRKIFFVCPQIGFNPPYKAFYEQFLKDFRGLPYAIGGDQTVAIDDPNVLGYVTPEAHQQNMREMRVMFYHSKEPNHIHYHPFEAVRAGMPLIFMAGGMLDRLGGKNLPGRSGNMREARKKIERILNDDWAFINEVRERQISLLDAMRPEFAADAWKEAFSRLSAGLERARSVKPRRPKPPRIAVILPLKYRGGSLRGAMLLAQAIAVGGRQAGEEVEVIFAHLDDPEVYSEGEFDELSPLVKRRPFKWRILKSNEASAALAYAGNPHIPRYSIYQVPDDGIKQFMDCDLWIFVSDRLEYPVLPARPYVAMVYDYLQRYENLMSVEASRAFLAAAHNAEKVFVTTEFSRRDAIQFAGLAEKRVVKVPMLAPDFSASGSIVKKPDVRPYFIWTTNLAPHKNHENALKAMRLYYEKYMGRLDCHMTGVNTQNIFKSDLPVATAARKILAESATLKSRLKVLGDLPDQAYRAQLSGARFLWHAARIDNGTFSVVEAAHVGVPSLSSDYPAMREIDKQFGLGLSWMDPHSPADMGYRLKLMEEKAETLQKTLPSSGQLSAQSVENLASDYWKAVRECL